MVALMRACSRAVRDAPDETAFFAALCRAFGEIGRYPYAAICLQGAGSPQLRLAAAWRSLAVPGAAAAEDLSPSMAELVGRALRGAVPVLAPASDGEPPPDWLGIVARDAVSIAAIPFPRRSGRAALVLASQKPLSQRELNFAGALVHLIGFASEVSGAVRHHALLLSIFPVAVFEADANGNWRYVSDWWRHLSGQTATDALGRGWMDMIHPDDRPLFERAERLRNRVSTIRCHIRTRAGETRPVVVQTVAEGADDGSGVAAGTFGTIIDVRDKIDQEEELSYARAIADQSPVVLYRYRAGDDLPVIYVSRNIERFGYSVADVLAGRLRFPDYIHAEDRAAVAATMHRLMLGEMDFAEQDYRVSPGTGPRAGSTTARRRSATTAAPSSRCKGFSSTSRTAKRRTSGSPIC